MQIRLLSLIFTLYAGASVFEGWRGVMLSLKNGRPGFDQVTGQNAWEHLQSNPQMYTIFNEAMQDLSASISPAVAASVKSMSDRAWHNVNIRGIAVAPSNNGTHPTPRHAASHARSNGAPVMSGVRLLSIYVPKTPKG